MGPNIGAWVFWSPRALLLITQTLINHIQPDGLKKHLGMYISEFLYRYLPYGFPFSRNTHLQRRLQPGLTAHGGQSGCAISCSANSCEHLLSVSPVQSFTSFGAKNREYPPGDGSRGRSDLSIPPGIPWDEAGPETPRMSRGMSSRMGHSGFACVFLQNGAFARSFSREVSSNELSLFFLPLY